MNFTTLAMGGAIAKPVFDMFGGIVTSVIDAALLPTKYDVMEKFPYIGPSPADVTEAWMHGFIDEITLNQWLSVSGIARGIQPQDNLSAGLMHIWDCVIKSKYPKMSIDQVITAYYSGIIDKQTFDTLMKKYGFIKEQIPVLLDLLKPKFDGNIILNNYFRGSSSETRTIDRLRRLLGCNKHDAEEILDNSMLLPTPSDLIRFAVRGVYNEDEVRKFGLDDEYNEISDILPWANAVGLGTASIIDENGNEITRDIVKDNWRAHWELMSPQAGYEALHRIRPERLQRFAQLVPGIIPFDFTQLNTLLKAQDFVPTQRKWLAAISYRTLQVRDVRRMYQSGVIDDTELPEQLKDYGYVQADVDLLVNQYVKDKKDKDDLDKKKKDKENYAKLANQIYASYKDGAIGRDIAYFRLVALFDNEDQANANLDAIDIEVHRSRIKWLIKMVKDQMFMGLYTGLEAYEQLTQGGVNQLRANDYVIMWQRQLSMPRKIASITTVLDWYKRILISFDDASKRLSNLGVSNGDILLYLESGNQDINKKLIQEQNRQARTEKQQIEESKRLLRELQANHKSAKADLNFYSSISKMKQWYLNDQITPEEIIERMMFFDIPRVDIDRYLAEWKELKGA